MTRLIFLFVGVFVLILDAGRKIEPRPYQVNNTTPLKFIIPDGWPKPPTNIFFK